MQAALGLSQLKKLDGFIARRRRNYKLLMSGLQKHNNKIILPEPTRDSNPSWFGFLITLKDNAGISRNDLIKHLTAAKIDTRLLFAGDVRKQPYFNDISYRSVGDLPTTEIILNNSFWIGVTPLIDDAMITYVISIFDDLLK